jgi:hypothetical protein
VAITYPGTIDVFINPTGANTLDSPDHATQHSDVNDAIEAIESVVGTTAGTNILKSFSAGDFPARINGSNVLQHSITGTATLTGGTIAGTGVYYKNLPFGLSVIATGIGYKGDYICDGVADEAQIGSAITALSAQGGGRLHLSAGTFNVSAPINLANNVSIVGQGIGNTIIKQQNSIQDNVIFGGTVSNFLLQDFSIDGNKANNATGDNGIVLYSCGSANIFRVSAYNNKLKGIALSDANTDIVISNCETYLNDQDGIGVASGTATLANRISIVDNYSHDNTLYGIGLIVPSASYLQTQNLTVMGNRLKDNGTYGIEVFGAKGARIIGNHIEGFGNEGIDLGSTSDAAYKVTNCVVMGNVIKNPSANDKDGINMQSADNCIIQGNIIFDDQGTAKLRYGIRYNSGTGNKVFNNNVRNGTASNAEVYGISGTNGAANIYESVNAFSGNGTLDASGANIIRVQAGTAGTVLAINNGYPGQQLTLMFADSNTTIADSGNFQLSAAYTSGAGDTLGLMNYNGTVWLELFRSNN